MEALRTGSYKSFKFHKLPHGYNLQHAGFTVSCYQRNNVGLYESVLALSNLVRTLYGEYLKSEKQSILSGQIKNLRYRLRLIKNMQALGILSFLFCIICMFCIYLDNKPGADIFFALSLIFFLVTYFIADRNSA